MEQATVDPHSVPRPSATTSSSHQERCGRDVGPTGFYADITADALTLPDIPDRVQAWSLLECPRIGMSR